MPVRGRVARAIRTTTIGSAPNRYALPVRSSRTAKEDCATTNALGLRPTCPQLRVSVIPTATSSPVEVALIHQMELSSIPYFPPPKYFPVCVLGRREGATSLVRKITSAEIPPLSTDQSSALPTST